MNKFIYCIWYVGISSFRAVLVKGELERIHGGEILLLFKIYGGNSLAIQLGVVMDHDPNVPSQKVKALK
jgi:hypothetical protein